MSKKSLKPRIKAILEKLNEGLHEREEVISVALLSALAGHNSFLFGPPGTAKSLISRRISRAFKDHQYFECLMNKFSTPEEVVGPVSIKALKEDRYTRKTEGYLPTADFAFLDEIWKSSPAILNTLLTLVNEKTFKNGDDVSAVPLKALIAASNETPQKDQGLEALYDRFSVRLHVPPMTEKKHFEALLQQAPTPSHIEIDDNLAISSEEWKTWQAAIHDVALSDETLTIIRLVRTGLAEKSGELAIYVSDRRWQRAAMLIKASAFFSDRSTTNHTDALLLLHCLWTNEGNRKAVSEIIDNAVRDTGFDSGVDLAELDQEKEALDKEIHRELFYKDDVYETQILDDGNEYFKVDALFGDTYGNTKKFDDIYIKASELKAEEGFSPVNESGNEIKNLSCYFEGQGSCYLRYTEQDSFYGSRNPYKDILFTPNILFHKGHKNNNVNPRLVKNLFSSTQSLKNNFVETLSIVEDKLATFEQSLHTLFIPESTRDVALEGINQQIDALQLRIQDCDRLSALCE